MEKYQTDKTFLARWAANELTEEERLAFEKTDVYKEFDLINREALHLEGPKIDTELALEKTNRKIHPSKTKTLGKRFWLTGIAACLVVLLGYVAFSEATITEDTGIGKKRTIFLPDGSVVNLNANSSISRKRFLWSNNKELHLKGEAYFSIAESKNFDVVTSKGVVSVLGTEFNVFDRNDFEVKCYEGSVVLKSSTGTVESHILEKGMQLYSEKDKMKTGIIDEKMPSWKSGFSKFKDRPISTVLIELENQYPIKFQKNDVQTDRMFTGEFVHNNIKMALESTLAPMGIKYSSPTNNIIILSR